MRASESYEALRNLYSEKEAKYDSFSKGYEIEKLVHFLIEDLATPLTHKSRVRIGKHEFDGQVLLGRGKSIFYEIYIGYLSKFRYDRLLDLARTTYFPYGRNYLLIVAREFSNQDKKRIEKLTGKIATEKMRLCFMDYEVLISLHRFSSNIQTKIPKKELREIKKLFLEQLFKYYPIINERMFDEALTSAKQQFSEIKEAKMERKISSLDAFMRMRPLEIYEIMDTRMQAAVSRYVGEMNDLLARPTYRFSDVSSADIPKEAGVYAVYDKRLEATIYIGRTRNLRRRLLRNHKSGNIRGSHFRKALGQNFALESEVEITNYILENCSFQFMVVKEFEEMVRLEHFATAVIAPVLNVQLRQ